MSPLNTAKQTIPRNLHRSLFSNGRQPPILTRPSSSKATKPPPYLTDDRKRQLVALYHQCETIITPETLSAHIDNEFVAKTVTSMSHQRLEDDYRTLKKALQDRRRMPGIRNSTMTGDEKDVSKLLNFNSMEFRRTNELKAALHGRDLTQKVGLELVEEYRDNLEKLDRAHGTNGSQQKP